MVWGGAPFSIIRFADYKVCTAAQTIIITEHESLNKKKRFDWTLRGHDPLKCDVYIQLTSIFQLQADVTW